MKEINNVSSNYKTCKLYKKMPQKSMVCLPMATEFQETVAMDLKFYNDKKNASPFSWSQYWIISIFIHTK